MKTQKVSNVACSNEAAPHEKQEEEEKQNSLRLQEAEERLQQVLNSMSDGFFTVDKHYTIQYATDRVARMVGGKKEEFIGRNLWEAFPGSKERSYFTHYEKAFCSQQAVIFEEHFPGLNLWFELTVYPNPNQLSVYIKDVTDRKKQEQRLAFIAKATSEVIWERRVDEEEIIINGERMAELFGYRITGNKIHRSFWLENIHPDDLDAVHERRKQALQKGLESYVNEYRFRKSNGTWAYVQDRTFVVKDATNNPLILIGAMEDVTEKVLTQEALQESENRYRLLFNNNPLCKIVFDAQTFRVLEVNDTAIKHFGYSREEAVRMLVPDFKPVEERAATVSNILDFSTATGNDIGVFAYLKKNGEKIFCSVSISQFEYEGRAAVMASLKDVTENKRLQEQLCRERQQRQNALVKATVEAQEAERTAIGRELHDNVNQIISSAKLYVESLLNDPAQAGFYGEKASELLQLSIDEIRRLSRKLAVPANVTLIENITELITTYRELDRFAISINLCIDEEKLPQALRLTIIRIYQELFNNTVKYAAANKVSLSLVQKENALECIYEDDGCGFDACHTKKGLGLHNIQSRVDAFNGQLLLCTKPGAGLRVKFSFACS